MRFRDFYPYYLSEHRDPTCRRLHVVGTFLVVSSPVARRSPEAGVCC
jgi:hypothetical protein